jgi:hypothetical protein
MLIVSDWSGPGRRRKKDRRWWIVTTAYVTIEEAAAYFNDRLHVDPWTEAGNSDKQAALSMATRAIDRLLLKGWKANPDQALAFPRYPDANVPTAVKDACCEEALALLERGNSRRRKLQAEGVVSVTVGSVSEAYVANSGAVGRELLSLEARELLRPWLLWAVAIT